MIIQKSFASVMVLVVCLLIPVGLIEASDKYGGGGSSNVSGSDRYEVRSYSGSRYGAVDVTDRMTGEVSSYRDWNGDGNYTGRNEQQVSSPSNRSDGGGDNSRDTTTGSPTTNPFRCLFNPSSCVAGPGSSCVANSGTTCVSAANYCGQTTAGTRSCSGVCSVSAAPSNSTCTNFPLGPGGGGDGLTVSPLVVRPGDSATVIWDVGPSNLPANCTLIGAGIPNNFQLTGRTGSYLVANVTGPHQYTLRCGTAVTTEGVRVLPVIYES